MSSADPLRGLAPKDAVPHFRSATPLAQLGLGPEEGFVLSRVDGVTRIGELLALVPFPPERTVEIVRRLWLAGAIEIPGHSPPVVVDAATHAAAKASASSSAIPAVVPAVTSVPPDVELSLEQVHQIDAFFATVRGKNAFELLGVARGADKRDIKRAYFKLSKDFHPDRFFGKKLGVYQDRLGQIFLALKAAFDLLSDDTRRAAYEESIFG
jgi:hypothetical protein